MKPTKRFRMSVLILMGFKKCFLRSLVLDEVQMVGFGDDVNAMLFQTTESRDRNVLDFNAEANTARFGEDQTIAEIIYWERPEG